jgi:cell division protein FtsX
MTGDDAIFDESEWNKILWIKKIENTYKQKMKKIDSISLALKALWFWIYFMIFIFVISIFIIIYSIIWNFVFHYRNEIYITKLIWWSKRFIYWPFILQWIFYSLIALFISNLWFYYLLNNLASIFSSFDISLNIDLKEAINPIMKKLLPIEIIAFSFIWALSWFLSSRKYSKEIKY